MVHDRRDRGHLGDRARRCDRLRKWRRRGREPHDGVLHERRGRDVGNHEDRPRRQDLVELFSYAGGKPMGIDYNAHLGLIVWADSELDAINSVDLDGTNFQVQIAKGSNGAVQMTSLSEPVDVAFDEYKTNLFFSHSSGIHYLNLQTLGTPAEWVTMTGVTGLSVDAIRAELFFCGPTDVHKVATHGTDRSVTTVYSGVSSPYGVAVGDRDQLLFYTAKGEDGVGAGVYRGTSGETAVLIAFIYDARFIAALSKHRRRRRRRPCQQKYLSRADIAPLPSPTSVPIQSPTTLPVPGPTTYPVPAPTALPIPGPTAFPIPAPTALPIPGPTTIPTLLPEPLPNNAAHPRPNGQPHPKPTALPVPGPTALPTAGPTPAPTSICEFYLAVASHVVQPLCNCRDRERQVGHPPPPARISRQLACLSKQFPGQTGGQAGPSGPELGPLVQGRATLAREGHPQGWRRAAFHPAPSGDTQSSARARIASDFPARTSRGRPKTTLAESRMGLECSRRSPWSEPQRRRCRTHDVETSQRGAAFERYHVHSASVHQRDSVRQPATKLS